MRVFGQHAVAAVVLLGGTPNLAEGRGRLRGLHTRGTQKSAAASVDPDSGLSEAEAKAKRTAEKNLAKAHAPMGDWKSLESSFKRNGETPSKDEVAAAKRRAEKDLEAAGASDDAVAAAKRTAEKDLEAAGAPEAEPANTGGCY